MNRFSRVLGASALAALLAGCDSLPPVFEDVGVAPHPPAIQLLSVTQETLPEPKTVSGTGDKTSPARKVYFDAGGLTVRPGANTLVLRLRYSDVGGDVVTLQLRDRDGGFSDSAAPENVDFFPGTSGEVVWGLKPLEGVQQGPHRLEVWAEDSNESRSEKVEFTVNVLLF